jgi:hypothetical protein
MECYIEMYNKSNPKADFVQFYFKKKEFNFNDYVIDEDVFNEIVKSVSKRHKLSKLKRNILKRTLHFGCSPKFNYKK